MAKLSDLVPAAAAILGLAEAEVFQHARRAREGKWIVQGGRGRGGAAIGAADCINLLLSIMGAEYAKDAAKIIRVYRDLRCVRPLLMQVDVEESGDKPGRKRIRRPFRYPILSFLIDADLPLGDILERLLLMAVHGELQGLFAQWEKPYLRLEITRPFPHARLVMGEINEFDREPAARPEYLPTPTTIGFDGIDRLSKIASKRDLTTIRTIGHRTFFALSELLKT